MTKGLEAFEYIKNFTYFQNDCYKIQLDAIKQDIEALEIIKTNFPDFLNKGISPFEVLDFKWKHKEEFELLKEVLK